MSWTRVLVGLLVAAAVLIGLAAALYAGVGPLPGGADSGDPITDFPTATATPSGAGAGDGGSTTATTPPFTFTVDDLQDCGLTCRDVTATLHNQQDEAATGVTVYIRIYAGQDASDAAEVVWQGQEPVGTLEAGASYTTNRRVELSLGEAQAIEQEGGWVTVVTTVETDRRTVTFRESQQVV